MDMTLEYNIETKIISRKQTLTIPEYGVGERFFKRMKLNNDLIAQIYAPTGQADSFGTLLKQSTRTAIEMKHLGLKEGDIISICSYNQPYSIVPLLAAQFLGVIVAPMDPTIELEDIKYLLNLIKPKMIFISDNCEKWIESAVEGLDKIKIVAFSNCDRFDKFEEFLKPKTEENVFEPYVIENCNSTAIILFSSGTTGLPKGICLSHKYLFQNYLNIIGSFQKMRIILNYASLYWVSTILFIIYHIEEGATRILCEQFDPDLFWKYLDKYNIDMVMLPPSQAIRSYNVKPENYEPKSLKLLTIGGSTMSAVYIDLIRKSLPNTDLLMGYGLTELGIVIASFPNNEIFKHKPYTTGYPLPGYQYKIIDIDTDQPLGFNKVGELRIKSLNPMNGYYQKDSTACYDNEGFLKTGDLLYYDEDFCFYVTDRIKEMFKYLSWHIIPAKLEAILEKHDDVQLAAVVGIPHAEDDNHAAGVVVLRQDSNITEQELLEFINTQVEERNRIRAGIKIIKSMPFTPTGKIVRRHIRDMILDGTINRL